MTLSLWSPAVSVDTGHDPLELLELELLELPVVLELELPVVVLELELPVVVLELELPVVVLELELLVVVLELELPPPEAVAPELLELAARPLVPEAPPTPPCAPLPAGWPHAASQSGKTARANHRTADALGSLALIARLHNEKNARFPSVLGIC
jgi:hypothetical protein